MKLMDGQKARLPSKKNLKNNNKIENMITNIKAEEKEEETENQEINNSNNNKDSALEANSANSKNLLCLSSLRKTQD